MSKFTAEEINNTFGILLYIEQNEPIHFPREFREVADMLGYSTVRLQAEYGSFKKSRGVA